MTDKEIYDLWLAKTKDRRYLKKPRWNQIRKVLTDIRARRILEFGSGVSTLLFSNMGLSIDSYETDIEFMKFVRKLVPKVTLRFWDNVDAKVPGRYHFALVDGILPRDKQLFYAIKHSDYVGVDDFAGRLERMLMPQLEGFQRVDSRKTMLAIFKII